MKRILLTLSILFLCISLHAQGKMKEKHDMDMKGSPCYDDRQKYCKGIDHEHGKIHECLKKNEGNLIAACKEHLSKMDQMHKDNPCHEDKEKYCKGSEHKHGKMQECLKENEAKLTAACKEHLFQKRK
ncbi:hypothetical protein LEP1GSC047_3004 [Leptospira inadai serovar Lyme str. 10]|uniref:Cysteine rich repeat domain protein n=2 Tax=Leptospira inadai serovar Lyme TaxID=293084 RepID=V6HID0_9LEPT|nr:hypothetical protein [Leptospira inadai]EQA36400.1 hypothetical protein LEP1GSC047_3004 [Leptospira inadai serovar Lyme str. 10]PNV75521.1 hypothetical protein BES34_007735 [Leptospira inadai serovar Lyme]